jgi:hypothetical protein
MVCVAGPLKPIDTTVAEWAVACNTRRGALIRPIAEEGQGATKLLSDGLQAMRILLFDR